MIHPVYGSMSQWDVHAMMTRPFNIVSAARSSYCFGSKMTEPPELPAPLPGNDAWMAFGPPNSSAPVARSSACRRWKYVEPVLDYRDDVNRAVWTARSIDDRRRGDPDFRRDLRAPSRIAGRFTRAERGCAPEDAARDSVERATRCRARSRHTNIMRALPRHRDGGHEKRLGVDLPVNREERSQAKGRTVDGREVRIVSLRF